MRMRAVAVLVMLTLALASCATPTPSPRQPSPTPAAGAGDPAADLDRLLDRIASVHDDPWHGISEADFTAAVRDLQARVGTLPAEAQLVEVMRLVALIGRDGGNGHMLALPDGGPAAHRVPIRFYLFSDGLFVTGAEGAHERLVGARVEAINGVPTREALDALAPLVNRDNAHTADWLLPLLLVHPAIVAGAGLGDDPTALALAVRRADGASETVVVVAEPTEPFGSLLEAFVSLRPPSRHDALWLRDADTEFWIEPLPEADALYAQYNSIWEPSTRHLDALRDAVAERDPRVIVVDLRHNPGGENPNYRALLAGLAELEAEGHRLVVLVGRATFSAAVAFATELREATAAHYAGEPTGGSPSTRGNVRPLRLDGLAAPMVVWVPSQASVVGPPGLDSVMPDQVVELSSTDYFAGADPVLWGMLVVPAG